MLRKGFRIGKHKKKTVIKCCLNKVLKKKELLGDICDRVLEVSKATNRGSLVFNRLILHCLKNDIHLPNLEDQTLFVQCFNIGLGRLNKPNPLLKGIWSKYFTNFPVSDRCSGNTQAIVYASKKYMTNFKNSLGYILLNEDKNLSGAFSSSSASSFPRASRSSRKSSTASAPASSFRPTATSSPTTTWWTAPPRSR